MDKGESKISNVEWGLVIGALLMIDLSQMVLEWLIIGFILNPFIDIFVGMSLALYLQLRGQSLASPKRLFGLLGTFFGEMIPVVAELPLWTLDGIFNMVISKSDKILGQIPGGNLAANVISGNKRTPIDFSKGAQEAQNLERSRNNRSVDGVQRNYEKINGQRIPSANYPGTPSNNNNNIISRERFLRTQQERQNREASRRDRPIDNKEVVSSQQNQRIGLNSPSEQDLARRDRVAQIFEETKKMSPAETQEYLSSRGLRDNYSDDKPRQNEYQPSQKDLEYQDKVSKIFEESKKMSPAETQEYLSSRGLRDNYSDDQSKQKDKQPPSKEDLARRDRVAQIFEETKKMSPAEIESNLKSRGLRDNYPDKKDE